MRNATVQSARFHAVALSRINLQDENFHITSRTDAHDLLESIRYDGLITAPLIIKKESDYVVVSGFRRIAACRKLGWSKITARILNPETDDLDCLRLAIAENSLQRPLNLIETSRCLQKLSVFIPKAKTLAEMASNLGLPANPSIIDKIKGLCLLPPSIQNSILAGIISLAMASELESMETDCAIAFTRLFDQLGIGLNKQKDIVSLVREIGHRDGLTVKEVMEDRDFIEIMTDMDLDRGQKSRKLRAYLRQRRYPRIVEAEKRFEIHRKNLKLGNDIKLIPPKEFESTNYSLNLTFNTVQHLRSILVQTDKIIQQPDFKKIIG